jgi:hypothetical protein
MYIHDPVFLLLLTGGAGYLMSASGVVKRVLEWKRPGRACPACGVDIRRCRCRRGG